MDECHGRHHVGAVARVRLVLLPAAVESATKPHFRNAVEPDVVGHPDLVHRSWVRSVRCLVVPRGHAEQEEFAWSSFRIRLPGKWGSRVRVLPAMELALVQQSN